MKKQFLKTALITIAVVGVMSGSALAVQITGGLGMAGVWLPVDIDGNQTTIELSTGIDFSLVDTDDNDNNIFYVLTKSGSFSSIPFNAGTEALPLLYGTINNFQFESFVEVETPLWSVGDFSYVMSSLSYVKYPGANNALVVRSQGIMSGYGFDDTPGSWIFTSQGADNSNLTWSASSDASPVPEPATMLLFGSGMLGLAFVGRKIRK